MFTEPPRRVLEGRMGIVVGTPAGLYAEFAGGDFVGQEPERRIPRSARLRVVDLLGVEHHVKPDRLPVAADAAFATSWCATRGTALALPRPRYVSRLHRATNLWEAFMRCWPCSGAPTQGRPTPVRRGRTASRRLTNEVRTGSSARTIMV